MSEAPVARTHRGWAIALLGGLLAGAFAAWFAYGAGQRAAGHDAAEETRRRGLLEDQLGRLEAENERLHARVAELETSRRLDRDAYSEIERTLGELQSQLARQSDDLAFYRSIVSPADGIQGLRIQRLDVRAGAGPREYVLRLTLVQAMRHESIVSGLAQVTIAGVQGAAPARLTLGELLGRPRAQLPFSFRYFQALEQVVTLAEGFEPYETEVSLSSNKVSGPVRQSFPWKVDGTGEVRTAQRSVPIRDGAL